MKRNRREFKIRKIDNFYYLTLHSSIKYGEIFIEKNQRVYNDFIEIYGEKIYATNDPTIDGVASLPKVFITKLDFTKIEILTLKIEEYNIKPETIAGTEEYGSYDYDIRPVVDKNNCIIVDMWKL